MKPIKRKRITIGDNSRTQWLADEVRTLRKGAALEPGEVVLVRFKEDVSTSGYVPYRVTGWTYRDEETLEWCRAGDAIRNWNGMNSDAVEATEGDHK